MFTQRVWRTISANLVRWRRVWWCEIRLRSALGEASMPHLWENNSSQCFHFFFFFIYFSVLFLSLHRGFGFVTFADQAGVDKVLAQTRHELDSKTVSVHLRTLWIFSLFPLLGICARTKILLHSAWRCFLAFWYTKFKYFAEQNVRKQQWRIEKGDFNWASRKIFCSDVFFCVPVMRIFQISKLRCVAGVSHRSGTHWSCFRDQFKV